MFVAKQPAFRILFKTKGPANRITVFNRYFNTKRKEDIKMLPIQASLKEILKHTTPYFEENIKTNFLDEIERRFLNDRILDATLKPAFAIDGNTKTELSQLRATKSPNFVVKKFDLSMEKLYIWLVFEIPELTVEGVYKTYGNDAGDQNSTNDEGNILFVFENVICEGAIPIQISEDSFIVKHYDLSFNPSEIKTKKSSNKGGKVDSSETTANNIDFTYAKYFYPSLRDCVFYMLFRDLAAPIVEFSVTELFADEPEEMIDFSNERCKLADDMINTVLSKLAENEKKSTDLPDFNLAFEQNGAKCSLQFTDGIIGNLTLWDPVGDAFAIYEIDGILYLEGELNMRDFTYEYKKCVSTIGNSEAKGTFSVSAYRPKFSFKASIRKAGDAYATRLDHIKFYRLLDVDYNRSGLENLNGMDEQVENWLGAFYQSVTSSKLCEILEEMFKTAIEKADLPKIAFRK